MTLLLCAATTAGNNNYQIIYYKDRTLHVVHMFDVSNLLLTRRIDSVLSYFSVLTSLLLRRPILIASWTSLYRTELELLLLFSLTNSLDFA